MKNAFRISVANPCSENFNTFEKTSAGGYCGSCEKEVVDFTQRPDAVIFDFFKNSNESGCGRFKAAQLKTYEPEHSIQMKNPIFPKQLTTIGFSILTLCAASNVEAQDIALGKPVVQTELHSGQTAINIDAQQEEYTVKGIVLDEENLPLPGASVVLKGTKTGTATDFDGKFEFPQALKVDDVLIFSYVGYGRKEYTVTANENRAIDITINFSNDDLVLMGDIVVGGVHKSRRGFFQRLGDLFR